MCAGRRMEGRGQELSRIPNQSCEQIPNVISVRDRNSSNEILPTVKALSCSSNPRTENLYSICIEKKNAHPKAAPELTREQITEILSPPPNAKPSTPTSSYIPCPFQLKEDREIRGDVPTSHSSKSHTKDVQQGAPKLSTTFLLLSLKFVGRAAASRRGPRGHGLPFIEGVCASTWIFRVASLNAGKRLTVHFSGTHSIEANTSERLKTAAGHVPGPSVESGHPGAKFLGKKGTIGHLRHGSCSWSMQDALASADLPAAVLMAADGSDQARRRAAFDGR
ncbi:hypothetical protein C8F04DRAFT_1174681 [Mycena alexandri]|uniref:Uncharacterized protein n=1 Tax=Mycena alexandri TaxID=1745969 RepID=A0AAD6XDE0_9AGAR|nr:hypothetical protein C8F04DRAFT_1174681 [Mycena alexandri]